VIIWTAFVAEYEHEKRKKAREYQQWVNENNGQIHTPDALISKIIKDLKKARTAFDGPVTPLTHGQ
jgi:poly(3-hydroxyalkanoate) synthetase